MATNYDRIARIYDSLSRIVFGNYIIKAQVSLLQYIAPQSQILLVGGGTGWILEKLAQHCDTGLNIDYVESSAEMIAISKGKNHGKNKVNFIHLPIEEFATGKDYDVIFTPFIFDNFKPEKAIVVFNDLHQMLKRNGLWLHADFVYDAQNGTLWQKLLLKVMYLFFRITSNIETDEIENMGACFDGKYQKVFEAWYYGQFIMSTVRRKL